MAAKHRRPVLTVPFRFSDAGDRAQRFRRRFAGLSRLWSYATASDSRRLNRVRSPAAVEIVVLSRCSAELLFSVLCVAEYATLKPMRSSARLAVNWYPWCQCCGRARFICGRSSTCRSGVSPGVRHANGRSAVEPMVRRSPAILTSVTAPVDAPLGLWRDGRWQLRRSPALRGSSRCRHRARARQTVSRPEFW